VNQKIDFKLCVLSCINMIANMAFVVVAMLLEAFSSYLCKAHHIHLQDIFISFSNFVIHRKNQLETTCSDKSS